MVLTGSGARRLFFPRALALLALASSWLGLLSFPVGEYDDSILLVGSRLVGSGRTPYLDFYSHYGPFGYTLLAGLMRLFPSPGLALRVGEIVLLTAIAILLQVLVVSLRPPGLPGEYVVAPLILAVSQVAMWPSFFGFAFAVIGVLLWLLGRGAARALPATLLTIAAGLAIALASLTRPSYGAYTASALLLLEVAAGRPRVGAARSPLGQLALLFGVAALTSLILGGFLYARISPSLAFEATVVMPARLISDGSRYLRPDFLQGTYGLVLGVAFGTAFLAATVAWAFAVEEPRTRKIVGASIAAGGVLPLFLLVSEQPARRTGVLALGLLLLTGLGVSAGRQALRESSALRASATLGIVAAAFGHYYWARSDDAHLAPFLTLALVGAGLCLSFLRSPMRVVVSGVFVFLYVSTMRPFFLPAAKLMKPDVVTGLLPWRCTVPASPAREAVAFADRLADPNSSFVAVGATQAWSTGNPVDLFLISSRLPYTRWFQYDPGLQSSSAIQEEMKSELEASGSRTAVVWKAELYRWRGNEGPFKARTPFDDEFDRLYPITAATFGPYTVRLRQ
jgi:hypothetical protein